MSKIKIFLFGLKSKSTPIELVSVDLDKFLIINVNKLLNIKYQYIYI